MLLLTALALLGQSVTKHYDIPSGNDYVTGPVEFVIQGFDVNLGTLDRVQVSMTTEANLDAAVENLTPSPCCAFAGWDLCNIPPLITPHNWVRLELYDRRDRFIAEHTTICADRSVPLDPFDGTDDFLGLSGAHMAIHDSSTDQNAANITGRAVIAWIRTEVTLKYKRIASLGSGSSCGGNVHHGDTAEAKGGLDITYHYH